MQSSLLSHPYLHAALAGFAAAFAALVIFSALARLVALSARRRASGGRLVFEGRCLVGSDGAARRAFDASAADGDDWDRAVAVLGTEFPALRRDRPPIAMGDAVLPSADGRRRALLSRADGVVTISFEVSGATATGALAPAASTAPDTATLQVLAGAMPVPVWIRDADGSVTWVNRAYLDIAAGPSGEAGAGTWPPPDLFDPEVLPDPGRDDGIERVSLHGPNPGRPRTYDIHAEACGGQTVFTAIDVEAAVLAQSQLEGFTQTLTKTFAHLTIGLAIFDQARRLILFNPALADLTGLPFDFLASKPTLVGVLDRLRERRIVPEPKDYVSWRRKMVALEAAALDGSYQETWSLPTGQTYRVTGRPHPDGAVIFLFEDISAEISLTRRYRAELEMGQAVIDSLDEAIAVFTADGILVMANTAYAGLWGSDPNAELSGLSVNDITASWHRRTAPTPAWGDFRDFARQGQNRVEWTSDAIMEDGRLLHCRFVPLAGGATLAAFRPRRTGDLRIAEARRQSA